MERYFTQNNVEVTSLIKEGKTTLFKGSGLEALKEAREARVFAKQKRSYEYPVFTRKGYVVGYGVPK